MKMKSNWAEIRCDFVDEKEGVAYIDAWYTTDDNEDGMVIAKVNIETKKVEYVDYFAMK